MDGSSSSSSSLIDWITCCLLLFKSCFCFCDVDDLVDGFPRDLLDDDDDGGGDDECDNVDDDFDEDFDFEDTGRFFFLFFEDWYGVPISIISSTGSLFPRLERSSEL